MKIINLTPHIINEVATGSSFPPSGVVARVSTESTPAGEIAGIPCFTTIFGNVELPAPQEGVALIVSGMVLEACKGKRFDLLAPGELVRNATRIWRGGRWTPNKQTGNFPPLPASAC